MDCYLLPQKVNINSSQIILLTYMINVEIDNDRDIQHGVRATKNAV